MLQTVTPEMASQMLTKLHPMQRCLSASHVRILADRIRAGLWDPMAGPVVISRAGEVIDGQHRLHAIARSGMAVSVDITEGAWSRWRDDTRRRSCAERNGVAVVTAAIARLAGRHAGIMDPDVALNAYSSAIVSSGVLKTPHVKPWGSAAVLTGALAGWLSGVDPVDCLSRLVKASPITPQERRLLSLAAAGRVHTSGGGMVDTSTMVFSAVMQRKMSANDMREALRRVRNG